MSELIIFFVLLIGFMGGTILGVSIGWTQRDKQRGLDADRMAQAILRQCEEKERPVLRAVK